MTVGSDISPKDQLSRFIRSKSHISKDKGIVKSRAFLPAKNRELSVCHTQGMKQNQIWKIGDSWLSTTVQYRADLKAESVIMSNLKVILDNNPEHHVNITEWPEDKNLQKSIALELANLSSLKIRNNT